jgi:hypothetical protein
MNRKAMAAGLSALLLAGVLAGCDDPPPPRTGAAEAAQAGAAAPPASTPSGPVTRFDGRYTGPVAADPGLPTFCPVPSPSPVTLVITQGRGQIVINPTLRLTLYGVFGRDGSARLSDRIDRSIAATGQIENNVFVGFFRTGRCTHGLRLTKEG